MNDLQDLQKHQSKQQQNFLKTYTEESLLHSVIKLNAEKKAILPGINFAGPLGNIAQLSACCRYKNPALTRCTNNSKFLIHQG